MSDIVNNKDWILGKIKENEFQKIMSEAAIERTNYDITYDPSYITIAYPNGDIPSHLGVCTDVVIRAYRKIGLDLQKLIHEDINCCLREVPEFQVDFTAMKSFCG